MKQTVLSYSMQLFFILKGSTPKLGPSRKGISVIKIRPGTWHARDPDGKGKDIPVTGCGGPWDSETLRFPHFLDSRLTDGGEVVSLTCQLPFTPRKIPGTHSC
jgi:hypothetical protein